MLCYQAFRATLLFLRPGSTSGSVPSLLIKLCFSAMFWRLVQFFVGDIKNLNNAPREDPALQEQYQ